MLTKMRILFANFSGMHFDVSTPERAPLGGTESCVAYLATELAKSNEVGLLATTHKALIRSVHHWSMSTCFNQQFFQAQRFDVIVLVNAPEAAPNVRRLDPFAKLILWNHHAPDQPALKSLGESEILRALDAIVCVSQWQQDELKRRFNLERCPCVIGNGLTPSFENLFSTRDEFLLAKELRAAYTSTPFRGLDVLLAAHEKLTSPIELDVFSSMKVYSGDDKPFESLYRRAALSRRVRYHGSVAQTRLAVAMRPVSFLSYPCTFPETYCIAALEAMAAGATVVATNLGALSSTTLGYGELMPLDGLKSIQQLVSAYTQFFDATVARIWNSKEQWAERMLEQVATVNRQCTWRRRAAEWQDVLLQLGQRARQC
jgi:glycosyltransferase involved in cell wall biosynthesis